MDADPTPMTVWPCLNYADAPAAIRLLTAMGFEERLVVTRDDDEGVVEHAELRWPEGGAVMLGSAGRADSAFADHPTGTGVLYVVTDAVDAAFERAVTAGATAVTAPADQGYGGRTATVHDPEGNSWTFGSYRGA